MLLPELRLRVLKTERARVGALEGYDQPPESTTDARRVPHGVRLGESRRIARSVVRKSVCCLSLSCANAPWT